MRILAIDGGGIRGLIPALVLAELERRTGRRVAEMFDLVAGTSTGGILAAALCRPDPIAAEDAVRLYLEEGPRIFERRALREVSTVVGTLDERYPRDALSDALGRYLHGYRLSEARPDLLITSYDLEGRQAFFFRTSRARQDPAHDFPLVEVCQATSAAPTYFEPAVVTDVAGTASYALVDGGVFANNPAMCALAEVARAGRAPEVSLLLSLGTGAHTRRLDREHARDWGKLEWAPRIVDVVFDGVGETVDFQASQMLGERYVRLQVRLDHANDDMDDPSAINLGLLREEAERLMRADAGLLDRLVTRDLRDPQ